MGQLVLAAAGAVVGGMFGMPQIGWAIGSAIGGAIGNKKKTTYRQQELIDLQIVGAEYGRPIPWLRGRAAIAGQMWWNTDRVPVYTYTSESSGGKGGGGETATTRTTTYDMDCLIGLTDCEIVGVSRIWRDGKLIWSGIVGANGATLDAAFSVAVPEHWDRLTVYTGTETQVPDATYESAVGVANAPGYRGRAYVFIDGLHLGQSGTVPNLIFEVLQSGVRSTEDTWVARDTPYTNPTNDREFRGGWYSPEANVYIGGRDKASGGALPGLIRSTDGITWSPIVSPDDNLNYRAFCYYPPSEIFVTLNVFGGGVNKSAWSGDDGLTWTLCTGTLPQYTNWTRRCMTYDAYSGKLVAIHDDKVAHTTTPKTNWTQLTITGLGTLYMNSCCIDTSRHRIVAVGNTIGSSSVITSDDGGVTWTGRGHIRGASNGDWTDVCYAADLDMLLAVNTTGYVWTSIDGGVTWVVSIETSLQRYHTCAYAPGVGFWISTDQGSARFTVTGQPGSWAAAISIGGLSFLTMQLDWCSGFAKYVAGASVGSQQVKTYSPWSTLMPSSPTVQSVQSDICLRAGLTASQFDVTALSAITRLVDSYAWSDISGARDPSEALASLFFYEATCSDKIYFYPRGRSSVAAIVFTDLGASLGDEIKEQFELRKLNDLEMPAQLAVSFVNVDDDYQQGIEYSDRLVSTSAVMIEAVQLNAGLTPADAKEVADVMLADRAATNLTSTVCLLGERALLIPTDVVTVTDSDSTSYRMRIVRITDSFPLIEAELVLDDTAALTSQRITSTDYSNTVNIVLPVNTVLALLDIPILRDTDDYAGFYVAAKGDGDTFPGAAIYDSADNVNFTRKTTVFESAVIGATSTALGAWGGGRVIDWLNSVTVSVGNGTLSSTTRAIVLQSKTVNAMLIGSEIVQFVTATLVSTGIYTLTGLLRGCRGTGHAMVGHGTVEAVVLLSDVGMRRVVSENSELGTTRYYKGVTLGRSVDSDTSETFENNAVCLKPFAPVDLRAVRDISGNITFTWRRRTRLATRFVGSLGPNAPLGENTESYAIDVLAAGSPTVILRTITATTQSASYTAAEQTTDFGSAQASVTARVYQLSANVGRGYPLEGTS